MATPKITYRGYEIEYDEHRWWAIKLDGKIINVQSSEEDVYRYIDAEKRKQRDASHAH